MTTMSDLITGSNPYSLDSPPEVSTENPYALQAPEATKGTRLNGVLRFQAGAYRSLVEDRPLDEVMDEDKYVDNFQAKVLADADSKSFDVKKYKVEEIAKTGDTEAVQAALEEPNDPLRPSDDDSALAYESAQQASDEFVAATGDVEQGMNLMDHIQMYNEANQVIASLRDKGSWWDIGWDIATDFFMGDDIFDLTSVLSEVTGRDVSSFSGSTIDALKDLRYVYQTSNAEKQRIIFSAVYSAAVNTTDDPLEQAKILEALIASDTGEAELDQRFLYLDSAAIALPLVSGTIKGLRTARSIKNALKVIKKDHVANWINRAMVDPELAATINSTPQELSNVLQPWRDSISYDVFPDPKVAEAVIEQDLLANYHGAAMMEARMADSIGWDMDEMKVAAEAKARAYKDTNASVNTITVKEETINEQGFAADVTYIGGSQTPRVHRFEFNMDDHTGVYHATPVATSTKWVDPETVFANDANLLVRGLTHAQDARALAHKFSGYMLRNYKNTVRQSKTKDRLEFMLTEGNNHGITWTWSDLEHAGVDDMGKAAYYNIRSALDHGWKHLNGLEFERRKINGIKKWTNPHGKFDATPIEGGYNDKLIRLDNPGAPRTITRDMITRGQLPADSVVVRLEKPYVVGDDAFTQAVISRSELSDWSHLDEIIPKIEGYYPIIRKDVNYVIRKEITKKVNGATNPSTIGHVTMETFSNKRLADEALERLRNADPGSTYNVLADREWGMKAPLESATPQYIGTGARANHVIKHDGIYDFPREDPMRSAARYFQMLDNRTVLPRWRAGSKKRLLNTVMQHGVKGDPTEVTFENWRDHTKLAHNSPTFKELDARASYITEMIGTKTSNELKAETRMWRLAGYMDNYVVGSHDSLVRKGTQWLANVPRKLADKDVPAFLRAYTFHPTLGMFNPKQLFMQAQGMIIPFSAHPALFIKNLDNIISLSISDARFGSKVPPNMFKGLNRQQMTKLENITELWEKSGFRESVMHQDDLRRAALGVDFADGAVGQKFKSASTFLFKQGELWNRRSAFIVAYDLVRKELGLDILQTDRATLRRVKDKAYDLMTNMQSANASGLQKDWKGVFFQFQQVWMKGLTNYLPFKKAGITKVDGLSIAERSRIITGQWLLFGMAGIPLGDVILHLYAKTMGIENPTREDAQTAEFLYGGLMRQFTGMDMSQFAHSNIQGMDFYRLATGGMSFGDFAERHGRAPVLTVAERVKTAGGSVLDYAFSDLWEKEALFTQIDSWPQAAHVLLEIGKISSTLTYADKARWLYKTNAVWTKHGDKMLTRDGKDPKNFILTALGIPFAEVGDYWTYRQTEAEWNKEKQEIVDTMMKTFYSPSFDYANMDDMARHNTTVAAKLAGLEEWQLLEVQKSFAQNRHDAATTDYEKEMRGNAMKNHVRFNYTPTMLKIQAGE